MKLVNQYIIPFGGLKDGEHQFDFEFGDAFFEENQVLQIKGGSLKADITLVRRTSHLQIGVELKGNIQIECDRCLGLMDYPLDYSGELFVKFKEEADEPDDQVIFLHPSESNLELYQYFVDCIGLNIPMQKFHEDGCDEKMMDILNAHTRDHEEEENTDPRWGKLKDLLNDNNKNT